MTAPKEITYDDLQANAAGFIARQRPSLPKVPDEPKWVPLCYPCRDGLETKVRRAGAVAASLATIEYRDRTSHVACARHPRALTNVEVRVWVKPRGV